jgi:hypothetical protein
MTSIVTDFKSINRKLNRQDQKAEFEAKNPKVEPSMYGWPYGVAVPLSPIQAKEISAEYRAALDLAYKLAHPVYLGADG